MKMIFSSKKNKGDKINRLFLNTQRPHFTRGTYANPDGHLPQHFI